MGRLRANTTAYPGDSLVQIRTLLTECRRVSKQLNELVTSVNCSENSLEHGLAKCAESHKLVVNKVEQVLKEMELVGRPHLCDEIGPDPRYLALYDELSGLPGRTLLQGRMEASFQLADDMGWGLALLFIDIDRFKSINDDYGHDMGDEVLRAVGQRLRASVRESDVVARYGGDEFVCLLMDVRSDGHLTKIASKIIESVSVPIEHRGISLVVNPSIGISRRPLDGKEPDELMRQADQAMYLAKRTMAGYAFASQEAEYTGS